MLLVLEHLRVHSIFMIWFSKFRPPFNKAILFQHRLFIGQRMSPRLAYEKMIYMYEMIEKIGGFFPVIFHNDTLAMNSGKQSWKTIYEELLSRI